MLGRIGLTAVLGTLGLGGPALGGPSLGGPALGGPSLGGPAPGVALFAARASRQAAALLAAASNPGTYSGHTSQHERISFTIASGKVRKLSFWIVIRCPSHHSYRLRASGFAPIAIRSSRFRATVTSTHPPGSATVTGRVRSGRVTGTLGLRQYVAAEHGTCAGSATYTAGH